MDRQLINLTIMILYNSENNEQKVPVVVTFGDGDTIISVKENEKGGSLLFAQSIKNGSIGSETIPNDDNFNVVEFRVNSESGLAALEKSIGILEKIIKNQNE